VITREVAQSAVQAERARHRVRGLVEMGDGVDHHRRLSGLLDEVLDTVKGLAPDPRDRRSGDGSTQADQRPDEVAGETEVEAAAGLDTRQQVVQRVGECLLGCMCQVDVELRVAEIADETVRRDRDLRRHARQVQQRLRSSPGAGEGDEAGKSKLLHAGDRDGVALKSGVERLDRLRGVAAGFRERSGQRDGLVQPGHQGGGRPVLQGQPQARCQHRCGW
jgi:hypothetical protein